MAWPGRLTKTGRRRRGRGCRSGHGGGGGDQDNGLNTWLIIAFRVCPVVSIHWAASAWPVRERSHAEGQVHHHPSYPSIRRCPRAHEKSMEDDEDEGKTELLGINHQMCIDRCTCSLTDGLNVGRKRVLHNYLAITCTEDLARFSLKCIHIFWVACLWPEYSIQRQDRIKWAKDAWMETHIATAGNRGEEGKVKVSRGCCEPGHRPVLFQCT